MARTRKLQIRLTEQEFETLERYAALKSVGMSEIIRDYVKTLMPPSQERSSPDSIRHQEKEHS
mgnify:CR=1 FL=1